MASTSWLYEFARAPAANRLAQDATAAKSSFALRLLDDSTEWITSNVPLPSVPNFSEEISQVKNSTTAFLNQTYVELDEKLHLQQHYGQVEAKVAQVSQDIGLGHIPPAFVLQCFMVGIMILLVVIHMARKLHRRRRHLRLYGNNAFPPLARAGVWRTARNMRNGAKSLPWFLQDCAQSINSSVFRLRLPFFWQSGSSGVPMVVAVGDLTTAKEILQDATTQKTTNSNTALAAIVGGQPNILTSEGAQWKMSRKAISPAFMKKYLDRMHHVCKVETEEWILNKLTPCVAGEVDFDIGKEMVLLTLSIICHAAFDYKVQPKEGEAVVHELAIVAREYGSDLANSSLRSAFGFLMPSVRRANKARKRLQEFSKKILQAYRKNKGKNKAAVEETIVSCIARSKKYQDDSRRIADILMFLVAGVDNTAYSLASTLIELAKHPMEAKKLKIALNGNDDFRAQEMLKDVLREGMRLRPSIPGIGVRTLGRDFYMQDKSMVIPKGSQVFFPSFVMTRFDVDDPETFRPARWREHPDKSFLLFSTGRRNCVGQSLALAEITWVLSRLCAKYEFQITEEGSMEYSGTMKCVGTRMMAKPVKKH